MNVDMFWTGLSLVIVSCGAFDTEVLNRSSDIMALLQKQQNTIADNSKLIYALKEEVSALKLKLDDTLVQQSIFQSTVNEQREMILNLRESLRVSCQPRPKQFDETEGQITNNQQHSYDAKVQPNYIIPTFYAIKSKDQRNLAKGQTVAFESLVTHVGAGFNNYTGIYTVPQKGTYVFMWNIAMGNADNHSCFSLSVNDKVYGQTYLWNNGSDAMSTGFAIAAVDAGDNVFMQICDISISPLGVIVSDIYRKTTFAGWCIAC